ncbi:MAG: hypothetical protein M5U34_36505, partial [Chloroflexi bacterium]|nr:hypothetical protein [Chloroflexota bacterium]
MAVGLFAAVGDEWLLCRCRVGRTVRRWWRRWGSCARWWCAEAGAETAEGNEQVIADARRITGADDDYLPTDAAEFASRLLFTCYMGTENSSKETRRRARQLAKEVGASHLDIK